MLNKIVFILNKKKFIFYFYSIKYLCEREKKLILDVLLFYFFDFFHFPY